MSRVDLGDGLRLQRGMVVPCWHSLRPSRWQFGREFSERTPNILLPFCYPTR
jgi:hypothetical protein